MGSRRVAWITGGANGIGAGVARYLAARDYTVLVSDAEAGRTLADEIGGAYRTVDVTDPQASEDAVQHAVAEFGGLDLAVLNAGRGTGFGLEEDFTPERYRAVMATNLDGVVYGVHAAMPALRARGGGDIVVTASLAGLVSAAADPIYGTNKHALVGLVRALGPRYRKAGVRVNALCPGFADTAIISGIKDRLVGGGVPLLTVDDVVTAFGQVLDGDGTGQCWWVQAGHAAAPYEFPAVPDPRPAT